MEALLRTYAGCLGKQADAINRRAPTGQASRAATRLSAGSPASTILRVRASTIPTPGC
jgi:hypothetical protein